MAADKWTLLCSIFVLLVSTIRDVDTQGCGNTVYTEPSGTITSPNYPENYNSNDNCTYAIQASQTSSFTMTFQAFHLESSSECSFDWVQIGCKDGSTVTPKYCGSTLPLPVVINNCNEVLVWFRSDASQSFSGFSLLYSIAPYGTTTRASTFATGTTSAIVPQNCGSSYYYGPSGVISSPNYPGNYSNYQSCNYYVDTSSPSSSIAVVFTAFDTEQCCDYVTISCPTIPLYPSLRYSGPFLPQPFSIPRCSQAIVNFTTDGSVISTGFSLDYYVNLGDCGDTVYTESHDYISSPNYPNSHDNNLNCSNIIWARLRSSFTINFLDMDLEECCDFVELSCIDNAEYGTHRFTGSSIPPKQDIPGCTQVLVWFHSDDSLVKPGFNLEYFANPDPDDLSQRKVSSNGMPNAKESRKGEERWRHH